MQTVRQTIEWYKAAYDRLVPDDDSLDITNNLWTSWESAGISRPNVERIHASNYSFEHGFFLELVNHAAETTGKPLDIAYCPFCIDEYNFSAFSASDGYVILVDDVFFQLLFFLTVLLVFASVGKISAEDEKDAKRLVFQMVETNYFNKSRFQFYERTVVHRLMSQSYDLTEAANYLFQSFKAFILCHEIGHHVLGHTRGHMKQRFAVRGVEEEIEIDRRELEDEFAADRFGYQRFLELLDIRREDRHSFFLYRFEFAPMLFFDLCHALDQISEWKTGKTKKHVTHPSPKQRVENLVNAHPFCDERALYGDLKNGISLLFYRNEWKPNEQRNR